MKITINPRFPDYPQKPFEVEANVVANIFALWKDSDGIMHMAMGDDGNWWMVGKFHNYWTEEIVECIWKTLNENNFTP